MLSFALSIFPLSCLTFSCISKKKNKKKTAHCTSHSFDLQSPAGHRVPPEWRPCPADWSPAASGVFPSMFTDRHAKIKKKQQNINRQLNNSYVMVKSNLELQERDVEKSVQILQAEAILH